MVDVADETTYDWDHNQSFLTKSAKRPAYLRLFERHWSLASAATAQMRTYGERFFKTPTAKGVEIS
jgi:hypothetical protein